LSNAATAMGRRTNPRLAQSKPPPGQGFRGFDRERQSVGLHRLRAAAHQAINLIIAQSIRLRFRHLCRRPMPLNMLAFPWSNFASNAKRRGFGQSRSIAAAVGTLMIERISTML